MKKSWFYILLGIICLPLFVIIELCRDMTGAPKYWRGGRRRRRW